MLRPSQLKTHYARRNGWLSATNPWIYCLLVNRPAMTAE
jgi:hypothetical protein